MKFGLMSRSSEVSNTTILYFRIIIYTWGGLSIRVYSRVRVYHIVDGDHGYSEPCRVETKIGVNTTCQCTFQFEYSRTLIGYFSFTIQRQIKDWSPEIGFSILRVKHACWVFISQLGVGHLLLSVLTGPFTRHGQLLCIVLNRENGSTVSLLKLLGGNIIIEKTVRRKYIGNLI